MFFPRLKTAVKIRLFLFSTSKMSTESFLSDSKKIFQVAVTAVKPKNLIDKNVTLGLNYVTIQGQTFHFNKNVHIVGFGKAVLGMAAALENKLKEHIVCGILSIPVGTIKPHLSKQGVSYKEGSCIKVYEGAANNIPDENSMMAASEIASYVSSLTESDLLFVLISGGGSALLPAPKPPLTLEEKQRVIKTLSSRGATIEELNVVRKKLSVLKGGKLALLAKPAKVISLILSDIIGDSLNIIASGPTVESTDDPNLPLAIAEKYNLQSELPKSAMELLMGVSSEQKQELLHVNNFIIGNNKIALEAAAQMSMQLQYQPIIMTRELRGIASHIGRRLIALVEAVLSNRTDNFNQICDELALESREELLNALKNRRKPLCLIFGGETTVEVKGTGIGGRNQELALSAAISLSPTARDVLLLSAGTDGIDGPTTAAGAIATPLVVDAAKSEGLDAVEFLKNNDSFTFFNRLKDGQYLINIGHTGTNVMDVIIMLVK